VKPTAWRSSVQASTRPSGSAWRTATLRCGEENSSARIFIGDTPLGLWVFGLTSWGVLLAWLSLPQAVTIYREFSQTEGRALNQTLARDDAARAMQLVATLREADGALTLSLAGKLPAWPEQVQLTLAHPTRPGMDQTLTLRHAGVGQYRAALPLLTTGKWHVQIASPDGNWRLTGVLHTPFEAAVTLAALPIPLQPSQGD